MSLGPYTTLQLEQAAAVAEECRARLEDVARRRAALRPGPEVHVEERRLDAEEMGLKNAWTRGVARALGHLR